MSRRVLLASSWTALLVAVCLIPGRWLRRDESELLPVGLPHLDKVVHGGMFAVFGAAWLWATLAIAVTHWLNGVPCVPSAAAVRSLLVPLQ